MDPARIYKEKTNKQTTNKYQIIFGLLVEKVSLFVKILWLLLSKQINIKRKKLT